MLDSDFWIGFFFLILFVVGAVGWMSNIVTIVSLWGGPLTIELGLRVVGIFVAPFGAILGYF